MGKTFIVWIIFFLLILGNSNILFASHQFPDVLTESRYHAVIETLVRADVLSGYPDGNFQPFQSVNRVEALKILYKNSGVSIPHTALHSKKAGFNDTYANEWYIDYVLYAKNTGAVKGYPDGTFRPAQTVKLVEALKMLFEIEDVPVPQISEADLKQIYPSYYPGLFKPTDWFAKYLAVAIQKNLILKDPSGYFYHDLELTRASLSDIVYRWRYIKINNLGTFPESAGMKTTARLEIPGTITSTNRPRRTFVVNPGSVTTYRCLLGDPCIPSNIPNKQVIKTDLKDPITVVVPEDVPINASPTNCGPLVFANLKVALNILVIGSYNDITKIMEASFMTIPTGPYTTCQL